MDDFRPDPSLGNYRYEHEMFYLALEKSMEDTSCYQNLPPSSRNEPDEVQQFLPPHVGPVLLQHKLMQHRLLLGLIERPRSHHHTHLNRNLRMKRKY